MGSDAYKALVPTIGLLKTHLDKSNAATAHAHERCPAALDWRQIYPS
jgi:hypothetical protein